MAESPSGADRSEGPRTSRSRRDAAISFAAHQHSALGELVEFLTGNTWPFHAEASLDHAAAYLEDADGFEVELVARPDD